MTVKALIDALSHFDGELEVTITDGFEGTSYHTNSLDITLFKDLSDAPLSVDIGIGGSRL